MPACLIPPRLIPPHLDSSGPALLSGSGAGGEPIGALTSSAIGTRPPPIDPAPYASRGPPIGTSTASLRPRLPPVRSVLRTVRSRGPVLSRNVGNERHRRQRECGHENEEHRKGRSWRKHIHGRKTVGNAACSADGLSIRKTSTTIVCVYSRDDGRRRHGLPQTSADEIDFGISTRSPVRARCIMHDHPGPRLDSTDPRHRYIRSPVTSKRQCASSTKTIPPSSFHTFRNQTRPSS
jgi:hypothetical protein